MLPVITIFGVVGIVVVCETSCPFFSPEISFNRRIIIIFFVGSSELMYVRFPILRMVPYNVTIAIVLLVYFHRNKQKHSLHCFQIFQNWSFQKRQSFYSVSIFIFFFTFFLWMNRSNAMNTSQWNLSIPYYCIASVCCFFTLSLSHFVFFFKSSSMHILLIETKVRVMSSIWHWRCSFFFVSRANTIFHSSIQFCTF